MCIDDRLRHKFNFFTMIYNTKRLRPIQRVRYADYDSWRCMQRILQILSLVRDTLQVYKK
jgi:hypothetical protein